MSRGWLVPGAIIFAGLAIALAVYTINHHAVLKAIRPLRGRSTPRPIILSVTQLLPLLSSNTPTSTPSIQRHSSR
jgi:hypothetical protein